MLVWKRREKRQEPFSLNPTKIPSFPGTASWSTFLAPLTRGGCRHSGTTTFTAPQRLKIWKCWIYRDTKVEIKH